MKFPVELTVLKFADFLNQFPMHSHRLEKCLEIVRNAAGKEVLCAPFYGYALDVRVEMRVVELNADPKTLNDLQAKAAQLIPNLAMPVYGLVVERIRDRKRSVPRATAQVGDDPAPVETEMDIIDLLLSLCGSTFEDYWATNCDEIIMHALTRPTTFCTNARNNSR